MDCLFDLTIDSCVELKIEIIDDPNFDIFDRLQEMSSNLLEYIFNLSDRMNNRIDKIESLYLSRFVFDIRNSKIIVKTSGRLAMIQ